MALTEIEFDLSAQQYELMGFPALRQGQSLDVQLEMGPLLPEPGGESWFAVQPEKLTPQFVQTGRAHYALIGQIAQADVQKEEGMESAALVVESGIAPVRVLCAPKADGRLPYGTWETRYLTGLGRLYGVVEEDFSLTVGERIGVTVWSFRRLILTPGDPNFGQWHEAVELPSAPFTYDRLVVTARLHRRGL